MWSFKSQVRFNVIVFILFAFYGCSGLETISDYVKDNPVFASASFRYATAKYIQDDLDRANQVIERASKVQAFIVENPTITVSDVMQYLDATIDWGGLDPLDRLLIRDILAIVEADLSAHETANPLINIKELLDTIIDAASRYGR